MNKKAQTEMKKIKREALRLKKVIMPSVHDLMENIHKETQDMPEREIYRIGHEFLEQELRKYPIEFLENVLRKDLNKVIEKKKIYKRMGVKKNARDVPAMADPGGSVGVKKP